MRKWALGSMSSSNLRLKFSESHPLPTRGQDAQVIEAWFSKLADQVVSDWSNLPLDYLDTWTARMNAVTVADIKAAFARKLQPERMVTVVVGAKP